MYSSAIFFCEIIFFCCEKIWGMVWNKKFHISTSQWFIYYTLRIFCNSEHLLGELLTSWINRGISSPSLLIGNYTDEKNRCIFASPGDTHARKKFDLFSPGLSDQSVKRRVETQSYCDSFQSGRKHTPNPGIQPITVMCLDTRWWLATCNRTLNVN